jgi:anaerobic ribonucleoside-triphosphate reductase
MFEKCPGATNIRTPTIEIKVCKMCGEEVEFFSTDLQRKCPKCGFVIYKDLESCIQWCKYAKECIGEELYNKLMKKEGK